MVPSDRRRMATAVTVSVSIRHRLPHAGTASRTMWSGASTLATWPDAIVVTPPITRFTSFPRVTSIPGVTPVSGITPSPTSLGGFVPVVGPFVGGVELTLHGRSERSVSVSSAGNRTQFRLLDAVLLEHLGDGSANRLSIGTVVDHRRGRFLNRFDLLVSEVESLLEPVDAVIVNYASLTGSVEWSIGRVRIRRPTPVSRIVSGRCVRSDRCTRCRAGVTGTACCYCNTRKQDHAG